MSNVHFFNPSEIEARWQEKWEQDGLYHANINPEKPKHYALTMLPYPSGDLHIGHWYAMTPPDARARFKRMQGFNVMFPMGFDAFGLPAENAAIKNNIHPKIWTYKNIARMQKQFRSMGAMFDWRRQMISSDPEYYRWTQWFFIKLFKNGLAYRKMSPVDWCPTCNTTLAREQVWGDDRHCERCGTPVIKKKLNQWFFKTTRYAEELLNYDSIDWPETVRVLQTNWIGRSEGASVVFKTENGSAIEVFTTRPDTLWGATFLVLAPEHPLVKHLVTPAQRPAIDAYIAQALRQSDIQREATDKEKTGVFTGAYALNPVNGERIPIWIADYVLMTYGTGAIMAVPAHDQRDFEFARKFGLDIKVVIQAENEPEVNAAEMTDAAPAHGTMIHSGPLSGTTAERSFDAAVEYLDQRGTGKRCTNYRLRDWLISRQRYWGTPIPMVHCKHCGIVPLPEDQLPLVLPEDVEWLPTGESPLKLHPTWRFTTCPVCGGEAERDTDTMDTFMCSSWYHLRYLSPNYCRGPFDPKEYDYWMPVDSYTGGIEHATMHLIYTRFFHKACRDMSITSGPEPMIQYRNQGIVLGEDSEKMSKSRGNVVSPDNLVEAYGADAVRAYLIFFARWKHGGPWSSTGIDGVSRWLRRVWSIILEPAGVGDPDPAQRKTLRRKLHQTIRSVGQDYESYELNTIVSSLMELLNEIARYKQNGGCGTDEWDESVRDYLLMLAPICPHISEEIWSLTGREYSIHQQAWPVLDENAIVAEELELGVQVNGKLRDRMTVAADLDEAAITKLALERESVQKYMEGKPARKVIYIPGRLVNVLI